MMTLDDVIKELKVSRRTIYRWIKSGKLPALKINGVYRIREQDYFRFLDNASKDTARI